MCTPLLANYCTVHTYGADLIITDSMRTDTHNNLLIKGVSPFQANAYIYLKLQIKEMFSFSDRVLCVYIILYSPGWQCAAYY